MLLEMLIQAGIAISMSSSMPPISFCKPSHCIRKHAHIINTTGGRGGGSNFTLVRKNKTDKKPLDSI